MHQDVGKDGAIFLSYYDYYVFSKVFHLEMDLLNQLLIPDHFFLYNSLDHVYLCSQNVYQSKEKKPKSNEIFQRCLLVEKIVDRHPMVENVAAKKNKV
jgi:hypothetical protein